MSLKLKKFDPASIGDNRTCIFIGKRGTGKTTLVTDILWYKKHLPVGIVMSGTEEGNGHYGNFVPDSFVYSDFDKTVIEKVVQRQRRLATAKDGKTDPRVFLLLDDVMYDKKICREKVIRQLFMNGRHWEILLFCTFQYVMDLPPDLRANVDYLFVLRDNVIQGREKLWKTFFGIIPDFQLFCTIMDKCTENYECLVLDNTKQSNKLEDCVYWYKAVMRPPFKCGVKDFWEYHKENYNPQYQDEAEEHKNKPKSSVSVQKVS
jgi:hypothetical protein